MNEERILTPESVQSEIKRTRHKWERILYFLTILAGLAMFVFIVHAAFGEDGAMDQIKAKLAEGNVTESTPYFSSMIMIVITLSSLIVGFGAIILFAFSYLFQLYKQYADDMSYSVRVSEKNYPEIYEYVKEFTRLLGWKKEPEVYIQQMNGEINAYSCWVPGKSFVHLNAEIVDLGYLEHKDFETIAFVMAHEFGHLYLHHVQIHYNLWTVFANFIPVVGQKFINPLLQRAREYSADRVAQALTDGKAQVECMMLCAIGRHIYKYTDVDDYMAWINRDHNIIERFARFLTNMVTNHPIMPFRTAAILDEEKKSGRLL